MFAATQASLRNLAKEKTPYLLEHGGFVTRRSLEQCSSEQLAMFKALEFKGKRILILAAGLGIDDWAFSQSFDQVVSIDLDENLNAISRYNFQVMQKHNIVRIDGNAEEFLKLNKDAFDLVYIDPDRRSDKGRQILLSEHQPNVIELLPILFQISPKVLIKCSPLYDYEMAKTEVPNISKIYSTSKIGEMKELLILANKDLIEGPIEIICSDIDNSNQIAAYKHYENQMEISFQMADEIGDYLWEVGACILKMRLHHQYAMENQLLGLDKTIAFYTSNHINNKFIGRSFKVIKSMTYNVKNSLKYLQNEGISKANVKARGLKFNTEELKKKLKLKDGGIDYLFAIPFKGEIRLIHCRY